MQQLEERINYQILGVIELKKNTATITYDATVAKGARLAVRCADLMPHTWEETDGSVTLGGCVRSMAWDPFGERLAVIFKGIQVSQERLSQKNVKVHVTTRKVLWVVFRSRFLDLRMVETSL